MEIQYLPRFKKQYRKLPVSLQVRFDERLLLFLEDPTNPQLRVHPLRGKYAGYWSINVSGDLRALYLQRGETMIIFALLGSHSELYG